MEQVGRKLSIIFRAFLWCAGPTALLAFAGWIWLAPSEDEIRVGTAEPPLAVEARVGMACHAVGTPLNMAERAKSASWISNRWVVDLEKRIKFIAEPVIYSVDYAFGRMIEKKFDVQKGFKRTLLMLATGIPISILLYFCGLCIVGVHIGFTGSGIGLRAFLFSVVSGVLIGMADLFQIGMEWYLLTTIAFIAGGFCLLIAVGLFVFDAFYSKFWAVLLLFGCVYGFVLGIVVAGVLSILAIFAVCAVVVSGVASGGFQIMNEPYVKKNARLSDGTELVREYGDNWKDSCGRRWRNVGGNTFECEDE